uniref:C2H2-type domain-containing protein n=1 Tax=Ditylenchus dipsaci TaxID=166011 RepID=A0A915D1P9_9BILA
MVFELKCVVCEKNCTGECSGGSFDSIISLEAHLVKEHFCEGLVHHCPICHSVYFPSEQTLIKHFQMLHEGQIQQSTEEVSQHSTDNIEQARDASIGMSMRCSPVNNHLFMHSLDVAGPSSRFNDNEDMPRRSQGFQQLRPGHKRPPRSQSRSPMGKETLNDTDFLLEQIYENHIMNGETEHLVNWLGWAITVHLTIVAHATKTMLPNSQRLKKR